MGVRLNQPIFASQMSLIEGLPAGLGSVMGQMG